MQAKIEARRHNDPKLKTYESLLADCQTQDLVHIVSELVKDARKGLGKNTLEEMLHPDMGHSNVSGKEIMSSVINSIAKTCVETKSTPEQVINFLTKSASQENFAGIIKLARLGTATREYESVMNKFAQTTPEMPMDDMPMEQAAIENVADTATPESTEGEIISALNVIKDNFSTAVEKLSELLEKLAPEQDKTKEDDMKDALKEEDVDNDAMKGAVTGLSLAGEDMGAEPNKIVDSVNNFNTDEMAAKIDQARQPIASVNRMKTKLTKTASTQNTKDNIVGWLADVANENNIPSDKIALAAKLFCSYEDAAKNILRKSMRQAEVRIEDETTHRTTIYATTEDLGVDIKDASFNSKFREFAVDLLSKSGYEVDPTTFALTEINVDENGMICGIVSTKSTKHLKPETEKAPDVYVDEDRAALMPQTGLTEMMPETNTMPEAGSIVM